MIVKELFAKIGLDVDEGDISKVENFFSSTKVKIAAFAGAVAGIGYAFGKLAEETAAAGEETERGAQRVQLSTDAYQELKFAAEEAGIGVGGLEMAMGRMENAAYQVKLGSTEAVQSFQGLLTVADFKKNTPDQLLEKLADNLLKIKDKTERAYKVMGVFGRSGRDLLPLLNKGSAGIKEFREEAHRLGVVLDEDAIKKSVEFERRTREFKASLEGLRNQIGVPVIKLLLAFGDGITRVVKSFRDWKEAHPELMFQATKFALIALGTATVIWATVSATSIGTVIGLWITAGRAAIATAYKTISAWAVAAAPFLLIATVVGLLILLFEDLYQGMTGGESVIGDLISTIQDSLKSGLVNFLKDIGAWLLHFIPDSFVAAFKGAVPKVLEILKGMWQAAKEIFKHPLDSLRGAGFLDDNDRTNRAFTGGASSPAASVAAATGPAGRASTVVHAPVSVVVNTHPGMSADHIVDAIDRKIAHYHDRVMRETVAGSP